LGFETSDFRYRNFTERRRLMKSNKTERQLTSEIDRTTLREYLERRLMTLRKAAKKAGEREEAAYTEGAAMEIVFLYDELLGEQAPEPLSKQPRAH
jgi:hypothetical protein